MLLRRQRLLHAEAAGRRSRSTSAAIFKARPVDHLLGLLGGAIWGTGAVFNFVAAGLVGVAISYAIGQAAPMVAALWGVFVWKEFRGANTQARMYLAGMFVSYLLALVVISMASPRLVVACPR